MILICFVGVVAHCGLIHISSFLGVPAVSLQFVVDFGFVSFCQNVRSLVRSVWSILIPSKSILQQLMILSSYLCHHCNQFVCCISFVRLPSVLKGIILENVVFPWIFAIASFCELTFSFHQVPENFEA